MPLYHIKKQMLTLGSNWFRYVFLSMKENSRNKVEGLPTCNFNLKSQIVYHEKPPSHSGSSTAPATTLKRISLSDFYVIFQRWVIDFRLTTLSWKVYDNLAEFRSSTGMFKIRCFLLFIGLIFKFIITVKDLRRVCLVEVFNKVKE